MSEHYNIDLLTTYKTEEAPDKIMERQNPDRKAINSEIAKKTAELREQKEQYTIRLGEVKDEKTVTINAFEEQEQKLTIEIKAKEFELGLLNQEREDIPSKVISNLKDESVIGCQKPADFKVVEVHNSLHLPSSTHRLTIPNPQFLTNL